MFKRSIVLLFVVCVTTGQAQDATPTPDPALEIALTRLNETPTFFNFTTDTVKAIYAHGQTLGNRAQVFSKIGDSDTTQGGFLLPIGRGTAPGANCELGDYSALQDTIDYYSAVSPVWWGENSFDRQSIMAHKGFTTASLLDYMWAESRDCVFGELPLECEYRILQPATVIIMLGVMDIQFFSLDDYKTNMARIMEHSIEAGVIPVLTTFVVMQERSTPKLDWRTSILFNAALIDLAEEYDTPLLNLWKEAQALPRSGIGPDETHLSYQRGSFCDFTGAQEEHGGTLRNLLTLQALEILRTEVFEGE